MKFGPVPPREAEGATAVHTIRQGALVLKKGTLIGPAEVAALEAAGIKDIVVARLEPGDVSEDKAAAEIAKAVAGQGVHVDRAFTGRANLFAEKRRRAGGRQGGDRPAQPRRRGDHVRDAAGVQAGGRRRDDRHGEDHSVRDERSLAEGGARGRGQAVRPRRALQDQEGRRGLDACCRALRPRWSRRRLRVTQERLAPAGASIVAERRVPHEQGAVAKAVDEVLKEGAELVVVFGASAIADRRDVIPAAVEAIGGTHRAFRHAGRSRQSDADRAGEGPARFSARRAARARPRKTASTGS